MSGSGMGQMGGMGQGMGGAGAGGYGNRGFGGTGQRSMFGSNPMQTRQWMQPGYQGGQRTGGEFTVNETQGVTGPQNSAPIGPDGQPVYQGPIEQNPPAFNRDQGPINPWDRQPGTPGYYPGPGLGNPAYPGSEPRTGGNDYFQESGMRPMPSMQKPMQYQPQMSAPYSQQAQPKSQPFIPGPNMQQAQAPVNPQSLIRPQAMMDPALAPVPQRPNEMQPGQTDWQWNAGFANGSPGSGWQAGFDPSHQAYISGTMPGFNQQQLSQVNYNDLLNSLGQISGTPYNQAVYGRR